MKGTNYSVKPMKRSKLFSSVGTIKRSPSVSSVKTMNRSKSFSSPSLSSSVKSLPGSNIPHSGTKLQTNTKESMYEPVKLSNEEAKKLIQYSLKKQTPLPQNEKKRVLRTVMGDSKYLANSQSYLEPRYANLKNTKFANENPYVTMKADPTYTAYNSRHTALSGNSTTEPENIYVNLPKNYLRNSTSTNSKVENPYGNGYNENPYEIIYNNYKKNSTNVNVKNENQYGNRVYNINPKTGYYTQINMNPKNHIDNELNFPPPLPPPRKLPNLPLNTSPKSVNIKRTRLQSLFQKIKNKFTPNKKQPVKSIENINKYIQNLQKKLSMRELSKYNIVSNVNNVSKSSSGSNAKLNPGYSVARSSKNLKPLNSLNTEYATFSSVASKQNKGFYNTLEPMEATNKNEIKKLSANIKTQNSNSINKNYLNLQN